MEGNIKVTGLMESSMEKEPLLQLTDSQEMDYGKVAKERNGLMNEKYKVKLYKNQLLLYEETG
jgi:hypothetical protein